ncbi:MAG: elongation factor P maturation arginine rhamnosyltransferase EarP [Sulfuricella sp.]|nr:elongation factor P maturation arginine rhamnosyltransferase EarP [Sulfuricella sp.]
MARGKPLHWDIFCNVVDNYGDIGVCWRLARQLAGEFGFQVRLWVDDLSTFQRIHPALETQRDAQVCLDVDIRRWSSPFPVAEPADVVVEAFGCETPASYVAAMAARATKPLWINLEYLSAEDWVAGCHGLPSPHPRLPLVKHFFFPGFTADSGGLLLENGLTATRDQFQANPAAQAAWWNSLGIGDIPPDAGKVSLFCYANPALPKLLDAWAASPAPLVCLAPSGAVGNAVAAHFGNAEAPPGSAYRHGNLSVRIFPFLEQSQYDFLLWACDCNLVRGEDSFVRALWAAKPLVWHIYPQEENAHYPKLDAFLGHYCAALPDDAAQAVRDLWWAWNGKGDIGPAWQRFVAERNVLDAHARHWAGILEKNGGLAEKLVKFCKDMIK